MASNLSSQGLHSLTTIIKRLEAATSRLEDLGVSTHSSSLLKSPTSNVGEIVGAHVAPPPTQPAATPAAAPAAQAAAPAEDAPSVKAFDDWTANHLQPYLSKSDAIGGVVADQAKIVSTLFAAQRDFIVLASQCAKPAADKLQPLLGPMVTHLTAVSDIKDANRRSPQFNHLSAVSEGIPAAGWVALDSKPGPYVADMKESANFYGNRVIKEFKDSDKTQVEWIKSYISALEELRKYIMQHHTTALTWNPKGKDASTFTPASSANGASAQSPAASVPAAAPSPGGPPKGLFAELGGDVTKGLKKVDKSEMTHKNPELRASSVVPASKDGSPPKRPVRPTKPASLAGKKPAKLELVGNRWEIEYQENNSNIILEDVEINQVVNIYGCKNSVIQVKGKVNAINLISSSKTSVLLDTIVSSLSITSSPSFTVQVLGRVPTVLIDSTDSGQVYLSKECLDGNTEIITAKSTSINISLPDPDEKEDGMFVEKAVPEQLKTIVKDGKLVTTIVEHSG